MKVQNSTTKNNPPARGVSESELRAALLADFRIARAELSLARNLLDTVGVSLKAGLVSVEQALRMAYGPPPEFGDTGVLP